MLPTIWFITDLEGPKHVKYIFFPAHCFTEMGIIQNRTDYIFVTSKLSTALYSHDFKTSAFF